MTAHRTLNWALAALLALLLSAAHLLDGPSELQSLATIARDAEAAQAGPLAQARFDAAAQALCGGANAVWADLGDGTVQCRTKRGHKTITAKVTP